MNLEPELLKILACPACHAPVEAAQKEGREFLVCTACRLAYEVVDDIPVMLVDEAIGWE